MPPHNPHTGDTMNKHIIMMLAIVMSLILSHSNAQVPFTRPKQWMQCSDKLCQIHIKNQPLAQFIHAFSIQTKLPIQLITSQPLKINLNLKHLSPMQCLYHLCQHYHLHYKKYYGQYPFYYIFRFLFIYRSAKTFSNSRLN